METPNAQLCDYAKEYPKCEWKAQQTQRSRNPFSRIVQFSARRFCKNDNRREFASPTNDNQKARSNPKALHTLDAGLVNSLTANLQVRASAQDQTAGDRRVGRDKQAHSEPALGPEVRFHNARLLRVGEDAWPCAIWSRQLHRCRPNRSNDFLVFLWRMSATNRRDRITASLESVRVTLAAARNSDASRHNCLDASSVTEDFEAIGRTPFPRLGFGLPVLRPRLDKLKQLLVMESTSSDGHKANANCCDAGHYAHRFSLTASR